MVQFASHMIFLIIIGFLILGLQIWSIFFKKESKEEKINLDSLINQMGELNRTVDNKFIQSTSFFQKSLDDLTNRVNKNLVEVTKGITQTNDSTKQFLVIAEQLQNLEKVLKHQKQRGNLGEAALELILSNILPPSEYKIQYKFKNGDTVDAIIKTKDGIIPVDAKFSLDNYNRIINETDNTKREELEKEFKNNLKKRIDETSKYIKIEEGTLPFAIMFIPAEGIYYDLLINEVGTIKVNTRNLIDYAYKDKNVMIVSPTTFSAYLQSILYGFNAYKFAEQSMEIRKNVSVLSKHLKSYEEYHQKLGNTLTTAMNHYEKSKGEFTKIDKDVMRISGEQSEFEMIEVGKPETEE